MTPVRQIHIPPAFTEIPTPEITTIFFLTVTPILKPEGETAVYNGNGNIIETFIQLGANSLLIDYYGRTTIVWIGYLCISLFSRR
jgi:hypothetical protein